MEKQDLLNNSSQLVACDLLPLDLMLDILCRLPVKSLLKFKCVSKSWYSVFQNRLFMRMHHDHESKAESDSWIFLSTRGYGSKLGIIPPGSYRWITIGSLQEPGENVIVGSAKGLVCLTPYTSQTFVTRFMVCNPALKTWKFIQGRCWDPAIHVSVGFGYDEQHDDFKILRVDRLQIQASPKLRFYSKVYIYSLRLNSWKTIENPLQQQMDLMLHGWFPIATLGSCLYWSAIVPDKQCRTRIAVFNLSTEKFHVSGPFPGVLFDIAALRQDSISLIFKVDTNKPWTCIWTMSQEDQVNVSFKQTEKSWLDMNPCCWERCLLYLRGHYGKVLSFRNNGEFIVRCGRSTKMAMFSSRKAKFMELEIPYCYIHHQVWCFRESLFSLDETES